MWIIAAYALATPLVSKLSVFVLYITRGLIPQQTQMSRANLAYQNPNTMPRTAHQAIHQRNKARASPDAHQQNPKRHNMLDEKRVTWPHAIKDELTVPGNVKHQRHHCTPTIHIAGIFLMSDAGFAMNHLVLYNHTDVLH